MEIQAQYNSYDFFTKQLLRQIGYYYAIYLTKPEFAFILHEVYNYVGHFGSKIV